MVTTREPPGNAMNSCEEYVRNCPLCLCDYDALQAAWCSCDPHPSKLCPFCLGCLCETSGECEMFWAEAPASLLEEAERLKNCHMLLGDLMRQAGVITGEQMACGLERQKETGVRFGEAMVSLNILSKDTIDEFLRLQERVSTFNLSGVTVDLQLVQQLGVDFCRGKGILPLQKESFQGRTLLTLVMADPADQATLERVQQTADCHVLPGRATQQDILAVLNAQIPS